MKKTILGLFSIIFILSSYSELKAQLRKISAKNLISEREIFIDDNTKVRYSDLITLKFNKQVVKSNKGDTKLNISAIKNTSVKKCFYNLEKLYGKYEIHKLVPDAEWGDTLIQNKRTKKYCTIPDWSQVVQLHFNKLIPIDYAIKKIKSLPQVEYAEGPFQAYTMLEPNDDKFLNENKWAFEKIEAEKAWDITKGDSSIVIAIHDVFGNVGDGNIHEDLIGKVKSHFDKFGNHGRYVAGVAGANTNNSIGVASLGWNLHLAFYFVTFSAQEVIRAINDGVDVINFSWVRRLNFKCLEDAVKTALASGVVCVAAAGNDQEGLPDTLYPAAYNFGELGQVIAVSATRMVDNEEVFYDGWNYSPGKNPIDDPLSSFIDVAAPGSDITLLNNKCCTGYSVGCGTSLATPFVSALVGLMLSIDSTLTPNQVYDIITKNTDKIGQYPYDENGWNQYLGYGRINAYKTLAYIKQQQNLVNIDCKNIPTEIKLYQNYPNPFNPNTKIKYSIQNDVSNFKPMKVTIKIFDMLGRELTTLVNENKIPGIYEMQWDASEYTSGVYFCQFTCGNNIQTKKMTFIK
ncbi:MAG: S8 family peptidase [Ignavibacteriales bacterium]|nr:S8 family peptidase [Ignavibacteriales bacterium]